MRGSAQELWDFLQGGARTLGQPAHYLWDFIAIHGWNRLNNFGILQAMGVPSRRQQASPHAPPAIGTACPLIHETAAPTAAESVPRATAPTGAGVTLRGATPLRASPRSTLLQVPPRRGRPTRHQATAPTPRAQARPRAKGAHTSETPGHGASDGLG